VLSLLVLLPHAWFLERTAQRCLERCAAVPLMGKVATWSPMVRLWAILRGAAFGLGFMNLGFGCVMASLPQSDHNSHQKLEWILGILFLGLVALLCAALCSPQRRDKLTSTLLDESGNSGEARGADFGLVSVLALTELPGVARERVASLARSVFRVIPASKLELGHFEASGPTNCAGAPPMSSDQAELTCDAYIAHSIADEPSAKLQRVEHWCERFRKRHNREPVLFVSRGAGPKCAFACVPHHLNASKELIVLVGETMQYQLWPIIEAFVFSQLQPQLAIKVLSLVPPPRVSGSLHHQLFHGLDVAALGAKSGDAEFEGRLLGAIEAGLGDVQNFNAFMTHLLASNLEHAPIGPLSV